MKYRLFWHKYKLMEYEKKLGIREINVLLRPDKLTEYKEYVEIELSTSIENADKLTYFERIECDENVIFTNEFLLEQSYRENMSNINRQVTRYSVHGLHEYKGKYNPQIVRSILNILKVKKGAKLIDPFCGSGTTLIESEYCDIIGTGTDINKLAVFIANTKLEGLTINLDTVKRNAEFIIDKFLKTITNFNFVINDARTKYLSDWFLEKYLRELECLNEIINEIEDNSKNIFLVLISNILREYSLQEPADLRIRRRYKSEYPDIEIIDRFSIEVNKFISNQICVRKVKNFKNIKSKAFTIDIRELEGNRNFDVAITSPPYATALPYIDTQRLSLVWLGLCEPKEIATLQSQLIGSRELTVGVKREIEERLLANLDKLPREVVDLCVHLNESLIDTDGFRRRAVPTLLYRYFADMGKMFRSVLEVMKDGSAFALVVGHNHTVIGGKRYDINTPQLLVEVARSCGWIYEETIPLEVYSRYGLNQKNATEGEDLIIFRKPHDL